MWGVHILYTKMCTATVGGLQHLTFLCWHDGISSYHSHSVDSHAAFITCYFSTIRTHWMCNSIVQKKHTNKKDCADINHLHD
jgi:hypothetical protein